MRIIFFSLFLFFGCYVNSQETSVDDSAFTEADFPETISKIEKSEKEWKKELNEQEYYVLRKKGTERPFTGKYWDNKKEGIYCCSGCGLALFDSKTKYKSGTGWPSFYAPVDEKYISNDFDFDIGYRRTELLCARCGGHLGHVFEDGPKPTGLRYCINSVSLDFVPAIEDAK